MGEEPRAAPSLLRRLSRDVRLWLTLGAVAVGAGVLAVAIVWQSEQVVGRQRAADRLYAHTLEVLVEVGRFSTALSETQRGARGFLLTADPRFLATYRTGAQETSAHLGQLKALTTDDPAQQRRLATLASDTAELVSVSGRMVELEAAGRHAAALALVRSGEPHAAMQRALAASAAVTAEEQRLLALRAAALQRATSSAARITVALAFLGAALLVLATGLGVLAFAAAARARLAEEKAEAREQQAATAALLSLFIAEAPAGIAMFDRQMRYLAASRRFLADYGLPAETDLVGRSHYDVFPEIPQRWRDIHGRVLAGGTEAHAEDAFPRADGRVDWVRWRMRPWRDAKGEIGGALLFSELITAQVEALRAHTAAETRLRAIVETAVDAIITIDEAGIIQSANPATQTLFGYGADELVGRNVSMLMPEPARTAHDAYLANYRRTGERKVIGAGREVEGLHKNGAILPVELAVAEWRIDEGRFFTGLLHDVSARRLAEAQRRQAERRELVVSELRHRLGNIFGVIQAMMSATARTQTDVGAYRDAVLSRVRAFAATQVELARRAWTSLGLRELLEFELKPHEGRNVALSGEEVNLSALAAESLAMVLHELATNAAKYGALSRTGGTLEVSWRLTAEARLVIDWIERGGPPVTPPERRGFGSTLIERSAVMLGGEVRLDYRPEGLHGAIELPTAEVVVPAKRAA